MKPIVHVTRRLVIGYEERDANKDPSQPALYMNPLDAQHLTIAKLDGR